MTLLQVPPSKGSLGATTSTDPLIYRFHEIVQVYGTTIKELIHENFGDGIMSAIDFEMNVEEGPGSQRRSGQGDHARKVSPLPQVVRGGLAEHLRR